MSSLRIALKQSLEETSASTPPPQPQVQGLPLAGRTSPHGPTASGSVTSYLTEEDSTSPVPKKRGPGRPRKYPRTNDQQPRKRGRPRKHPPVSDEDAFSSENEFSVGGGEDPESEHVHDEAMSSAATKIQSHWKRANGKTSLLEGSAVAEPPGSVAGEPQNESLQAGPGEEIDAAVPAPVNQSKPVSPPAHDLVEWMRHMSVKRARKAVASGLRVKVRFVTNNKVKKDGKVSRKRIWYGGRITAVSKEGSKIRIKYDDKTSEVTQFPDKDVVIDDYLNGKHQVNADKFVPPDDKGDGVDEDLFGEGPEAEEEHHTTQPTRAKETSVEEPKAKGEKTGASSKVLSVEVAYQTEPEMKAEKEPVVKKTDLPASSSVNSITKSFSEMSTVRSQHKGHSPVPPKTESQLHPDKSQSVSDKPVEDGPPPEKEMGNAPPDTSTSSSPLPETPKHEAAGTREKSPRSEEVQEKPSTTPQKPPPSSPPAAPPAAPTEPAKESKPSQEAPDELKGLTKPTSGPPAETANAPAASIPEPKPQEPEKLAEKPSGIDREKPADPASENLPAEPLAVEMTADKPTTEPTDMEIERSLDAEQPNDAAQTSEKGELLSTAEKPSKSIAEDEHHGEVAKSEKKPSSAGGLAEQLKGTEYVNRDEQKVPEPVEQEPTASYDERSKTKSPLEETPVGIVSDSVDKVDVKDKPGKGNMAETKSKLGAPAESSSPPPPLNVEPEKVDKVSNSHQPKLTSSVPAPEEGSPGTSPPQNNASESKPDDTSKDEAIIDPAPAPEEKTGPKSDTTEPQEAKDSMPAPAPKVETTAQFPEQKEEPVKPKRKRGRPPKNRPPADSVSQEKNGPKAGGSVVSTESAVRVSSVESEVSLDPSEQSEPKETDKPTAAKKSASSTAGSDPTAKGSVPNSTPEGKESSSKPSLTIRIPNLKKVDTKQSGNSKKGDAKRESSTASGDAEAPRGKKRSSGSVEEEPPAKRLHIHIGSKGSQENLSDNSEKPPTSKSDIGTFTKHTKSAGDATMSTKEQPLSPRPKKAKRKRDVDLTPRVGPKPSKKHAEKGDLPSEATKGDRASNDFNGVDNAENRSSKTSVPVQDERDEKLGTPDVRTKSDAQSAARSGRRAAQQANERISSKNDIPDQATKKKKKKRREMDDAAIERDEEIPAFQWVQCDKCAKWRIIPSSVVEKLPPMWFCADNKWDAKRASCDAPEQTPKQVAKERKRKKRKLMMEREAAEAAERVAAAEGEQADVSSSPRNSSPRNSDDAVDTHRASPSEHSFDSGHGGDPSKVDKKGLTSSKKTKNSSAVEAAQMQEEEPKPRGRGRPRRNPPKEVSTPSVPPTNPHGSAPPATDEADNLEWVQCEKCDKWRKLPPHISADELPDVWYCSMNTWNPGSASCSAPEDKADGLQDIFNNNATSGKLSYRNLIFGSNGRKHNRPISERTRAAESLFAAVSDDSDAPPAVMYANSSAFICRSKMHQQADENEGPTMLDLMSRSHLWAQLQKSQPKAAPLLFDALSAQARESLKDIVLHCLGAQTLTGEQLHQQVRDRNWENAPLGWTSVRKYCSENMIVMTMCELVKMGVLECFRVDGPFSNGQLWTLCYRRAKTHSPVPPAAAASKVVLPPNGSRCMKIAKPWKRVSP